MRNAHVGAVKRTRLVEGAPTGAIKMLVPILERGDGRIDKATKCWVLSRGGEPVASITPTQKIRAFAAGDDVVWAFDQDDPDAQPGVRYRIVEVKSARS